MIRLQNNYAITSSGGSFALVTFVKGKDKEGNEIDVQKQIELEFERTKNELLKEFDYLEDVE
jgi:hypothetical protein